MKSSLLRLFLVSPLILVRSVRGNASSPTTNQLAPSSEYDQTPGTGLGTQQHSSHGPPLLSIMDTILDDPLRARSGDSDRLSDRDRTQTYQPDGSISILTNKAFYSAALDVDPRPDRGGDLDALLLGRDVVSRGAGGQDQSVSKDSNSRLLVKPPLISKGPSVAAANELNANVAQGAAKSSGVDEEDDDEGEDDDDDEDNEDDDEEDENDQEEGEGGEQGEGDQESDDSGEDEGEGEPSQTPNRVHPPSGQSGAAPAPWPTGSSQKGQRWALPIHFTDLSSFNVIKFSTGERNLEILSRGVPPSAFLPSPTPPIAPAGDGVTVVDGEDGKSAHGSDGGVANGKDGQDGGNANGADAHGSNGQDGFVVKSSNSNKPIFSLGLHKSTNMDQEKGGKISNSTGSKVSAGNETENGRLDVQATRSSTQTSGGAKPIQLRGRDGRSLASAGQDDVQGSSTARGKVIHVSSTILTTKVGGGAAKPTLGQISPSPQTKAQALAPQNQPKKAPSRQQQQPPPPSTPSSVRNQPTKPNQPNLKAETTAVVSQGILNRTWTQAQRPPPEAGRANHTATKSSALIPSSPITKTKGQAIVEPTSATMKTPKAINATPNNNSSSNKIPPPSNPYGPLPALAVPNDGRSVISISYPKGSSNPGSSPVGGSQFYALTSSLNLSTATRVTLNYSVLFPLTYDFVKGGKLPGLYGGSEGCSGGNSASDCWSSRMMWRGQGLGELYLYLPQASQDPSLCLVPPYSECNSEYGISVGRGSFRFRRGAWNHISQTIQLNSSPTSKDGGFIIRFEGQQVVRFENKVFYPASFKGIFFSTFYGGHGQDWSPSSDQKSYFRDFSVSIDS